MYPAVTFQSATADGVGKSPHNKRKTKIKTNPANLKKNGNS